MKIVSYDSWETWLLSQNQVHILQLAQWGALKEKYGWEVVRFLSNDGKAGAQILFRKIILGLHLAYIPKGPVGQLGDDFWEEVHLICRDRKAIFLKVEPDIFEDETPSGVFGSDKFQPSQSIQPRRTIVVDLSGDQDAWLASMKQKTRYNIRLAQKKEVEIRESADVDSFYEIMLSTGDRDQFGIHTRQYYRDAFRLFSSIGRAALFLAYYQDTPLAGIMVFRSGARAWYFYGASNDKERNRMPAYLLQFIGMQWAKTHGATTYDLWGIPDFDEELLEDQFSSRSEGLWGVYRFKRGFGGRVLRYEQAYDYVYRPLIYRLIQMVLSRRSAG